MSNQTIDPNDPIYQSELLNANIRMTNHCIQVTKNSISFYEIKESEARLKYGDNPNEAERGYLRWIKKSLKKSKAELKYQENVLADLLQKQRVRSVFK